MAGLDYDWSNVYFSTQIDKEAWELTEFIMISQSCLRLCYFNISQHCTSGGRKHMPGMIPVAELWLEII